MLVRSPEASYPKVVVLPSGSVTVVGWPAALEVSRVRFRRGS